MRCSVTLPGQMRFLFIPSKRKLFFRKACHWDVNEKRIWSDTGGFRDVCLIGKAIQCFYFIFSSISKGCDKVENCVQEEKRGKITEKGTENERKTVFGTVDNSATERWKSRKQLKNTVVFCG